MRGFIGILITGAIALTAGFIGFQAGVASNIGTTGGVVWLGWGFPGFGFLFFLLFLGFLFFAVGGRRRAWGHGGMRGYGPWGGPFDPMSGDGSDARRRWIADAHRRLHEEEAAAAFGTGSDPGSNGPTGTGGTQPD